MSSSCLIATLPYLARSEKRPVYQPSTAGVGDDHEMGLNFDFRDVYIFDARALEAPATLDKQGFMLVSHPSAVTDFYALDSVRENYEAEIRQLVLSATGGSEALVFDHTLRSDSSAIRSAKTTREPAAFIHNDYTDKSARQRLMDVLPAQKAGKRLEQRFAIINVWRSINGVVWTTPITCCDASTIAKEDLVAAERRAQDRIGELELVTWNPAHRWYYFPEMSPPETLLIKTFDSARDGRATRSIHTSFENPLAPEKSPPRESIESRLLVFFD